MKNNDLAGQVLSFCRTWDMLPRNGAVLVAVSGGRDSMALLHLLLALREREGFSLSAAHFNHHLRPGAGQDEAFVRTWCARHGVPLTVGGGDVAGYAASQGKSIEDAGRILRYAFLEETARVAGCARIATAHHRQDNAETVLLHIFRGAGSRGLSGIPPVRGNIIRPLLETDRTDIDAYVAAQGIPYVEDETNAQTAYTRNRLRLELLPLLEEFSPGCTQRIARTAELLRAEEEHLSGESESLLAAAVEERGALSLPITVFLAQDAAIQRRLVRAMALRFGISLTAGQSDAVRHLGTGGCLDLPQGLRALRLADQLTFQLPAVPPAPLVLRPGTQLWGGYAIRLWMAEAAPPPSADTILLDAASAAGQLTISPWDGTGRLSVSNGSRSIKRLFADRGIPLHQRSAYPALYLDARPAAIFGVVVDAALSPRPGRPCLAVTITRRDVSPQADSPAPPH